MMNIRMWCLFVFISVFGIAGSQAQQHTGAAEKAVAALENKWIESLKQNDPTIIAPLLAGKFVSTASDGTVTDKTQTLADQGARRYVSAEYRGVQVTVFGDTAIATGWFRGTGTDASGKHFDDHERWTDTWSKMSDGKWLCVASQSTLVTK